MHAFLLVPTLLLLFVSLATLIFAILAARPKETTGLFIRDDVEKRNVNLLHFGSFHNSSREDFEWGMKEMMKDSEYSGDSMMGDLYFLGREVGIKFRYLRVAYIIFMWGMIVSVVAFTIAILSATLQ
ncbi:MAG: Pycsar system effector family protein [bacterium]